MSDCSFGMGMLKANIVVKFKHCGNILFWVVARMLIRWYTPEIPQVER